MHRLWSDGRWNKLTIAHGCYWKQCTFCDVTLDYIARYDRAPADLLVDRIEAMIAETGQTGFHFVDEAAPPAALARARRAAARAQASMITWWGNVRFEKAFTPELARAARALGLRRDQRRPRGRVRSPARADEEGRHRRAGRARHPRVHRRRRDGPRLPDVRLPDRDRAGDRSTRSSACASCSPRAASSPRSGTASPRPRTARSAGSPSCSASRCARRRGSRSRGTTSRSTIRPAAITTSSRAGLRKALYNYMHGLGLDADPRSWFERPRARGRAAHTPAIPRVSVPPDLIARALAARE